MTSIKKDRKLLIFKKDRKWHIKKDMMVCHPVFDLRLNSHFPGLCLLYAPLHNFQPEWFIMYRVSPPSGNVTESSLKAGSGKVEYGRVRVARRQLLHTQTLIPTCSLCPWAHSSLFYHGILASKPVLAVAFIAVGIMTLWPLTWKHCLCQSYRTWLEEVRKDGNAMNVRRNGWGAQSSAHEIKLKETFGRLLSEKRQGEKQKKWECWKSRR